MKQLPLLSKGQIWAEHSAKFACWSWYLEEYDEYKSVFIAGGIYNVFLFGFTNNCKENPEDLAKRLEDIFMK